MSVASWFRSKQQLVSDVANWRGKYEEIVRMYDQMLQTQSSIFETKLMQAKESEFGMFCAGAKWEARRNKRLEPLPHKLRRGYEELKNPDLGHEYD